MDEYYSADTADTARSPNTMLGISGQPASYSSTGDSYSSAGDISKIAVIKASEDKELREKALMYAVQAFASDPQLDIVAMAEAFLDHLRGAES